LYGAVAAEVLLRVVGEDVYDSVGYGEGGELVTAGAALSRDHPGLNAAREIALTAECDGSGCACARRVVGVCVRHLDVGTKRDWEVDASVQWAVVSKLMCSSLLVEDICDELDTADEQVLAEGIW
jgi:hypothetical protein